MVDILKLPTVCKFFVKYMDLFDKKKQHHSFKYYMSVGREDLNKLSERHIRHANTCSGSGTMIHFSPFYILLNEPCCEKTGVTVYLDPLGSLTPGGQATLGYLDPHPGYLDPPPFFFFIKTNKNTKHYLIMVQLLSSVKLNCHCELIKKIFTLIPWGWGSRYPGRVS